MEGILQGVYRPRNPQATSLHHLVEDNFDELERIWDDRYEKQHGFWRPVIRHVVEQYLTCGDLRCGFARLRCPPCREDFLLPYSCKRRCFCPSCHQKRALFFAEHVEQEVLGQVPIRQYVVTIPKMLCLCSAPFVVSDRTCNPVARIFQQTFEPHPCYSLHRPKKRFPIIFSFLENLDAYRIRKSQKSRKPDL